MTASDQQQSRQRITMTDKIEYIPVDIPEEEEFSSNYSSDDSADKKRIENCDNIMSTTEARNFELERGIDYDAVDELVRDINELRKGLLVLLLIFVAIAGFIALDDYYNSKIIISDNDGTEQIRVEGEEVSNLPHPHRGHKLQINASAFTVNDYECLQLDTGNWPSERVHCELRPSIVENNSENDGNDVARYDFVVEHFDDKNCQKPNAKNPIVRHTASGCYYFEGYNHSYNDVCHVNRTLTVSAFYGPGCLTPMNVTSVNTLPEDGE